MRKVLAVVVIAILTLHFATALLAAPADNTHPMAAVKGVSLPGKVSADGKRFETDDDNSWFIANSEVLKGFENRYITIKCRLAPEKRSLWIVSVETRGDKGPRIHDAAFRR